MMHSGIRLHKRFMLVLIFAANEVLSFLPSCPRIPRIISSNKCGVHVGRPEQQRCTDIVTRRYRNSRELEYEYEHRSRATTSGDPNTSAGPFAIVRERIRRTFFLLSQFIFRMKKAFRYLVEKHTIYVLECEGGKYYVGSTSHRKQRYRQHMHSDRGGSAFTRLHKPLRVCAEHRRIPRKFYLGMEAQVLAEYMLQYGINNCRGAMFSETRNMTTADLDSLTAFLGHYCDLNYAHIRSTLAESLPAAAEVDGGAVASKRRKRKRARMRKKMKAKKKERCFNCGELGHYSYECPAARHDEEEEVGGGGVDVEGKDHAERM